jgi:two-component system chemotaxis response regulator CheB
MPPTWLGSARDEALEIVVPPSGVAVVLVAKAPLPPVPCSRLALIPAAKEGLKTELQKLAAPKTWLGTSGLKADNIDQIRLLGSRQATAQAAAWLGQAGVPIGRPVLLSEARHTVYFSPKGGRLQMRIADAESSIRSDAQAPSAAASLAPSEKLRVLIVDDSKTMRDLLVRILAQDPSLEVVGTIAEPQRVEQAVHDLKPHVVTLDIHMGEMSGVDVVRRIFPIFRIPIVMISSLSASDGNFVFDALLCGAVDYIQKPSMAELPVVGPMICEKVRNAAMSRASAHGNATPGKRTPVTPAQPVDMDSLIAIGSSTGGVEALREVLTQLPEKIPPIVIVQHIPAVFSKAFADRMNTLCPFTVKEAENNETVTANKVLIAPGGLQMNLRQAADGLRVGIVDAEPVNRHKPSVDYLFDSIVALKHTKVVAAILTGMGGDGARGLLKLRQSGARTLAQDEATCVVYGMPREAAKLGGAEEVVPLPQVAAVLLKFCQFGQPRRHK